MPPAVCAAAAQPCPRAPPRPQLRRRLLLARSSLSLAHTQQADIEEDIAELVPIEGSPALNGQPLRTCKHMMFEGPVCEPQVQDEDRLEAGQYWWQWLDLGRTPTLRPIGQALEIIDRLVVALFDLSIPEPRLHADRLFSCARAF